MINETLLVSEWLEGENLDHQIEYRMCYLLAKWFIEHGAKSKIEIRESIFDWAKKYSFFLTVNVNECIRRALENSRRLTTDNSIRVSKEDVQEIVRRFDKKNTRLCALGFLVYAKQFADQKGVFDIPMVAFGKWIGIAYNNISSNYIHELEDFEYIERYAPKVTRFRNKPRTRSPKFIIKVPILNCGEYTLQENDIRKLYDDIFIYESTRCV